MSKLIAVVFAAWALGMLGFWLLSEGYVMQGKLLVYTFGSIGILCIFAGLLLIIKDRFFSPD